MLSVDCRVVGIVRFSIETDQRTVGRQLDAVDIDGVAPVQ
jgi:hypothetical protein